MRELENILERALTLATGDAIDVTDIQLKPQPAQVADDSMEPKPPEEDLGSPLEEMEKDAIVKALEDTRYNKTAAAKRLGISFRALRYRIKKLGIE